MHKRFIAVFLVAIILITYILYKYHLQLQLTVNSTINSLYTPDSFSIEDKQNYDFHIAKGIKEMATKKVVITGLLRDVENNIPTIIKKAESLGNLFQDYAVLIVENDSSDHTRKLLLEWASKNPKVEILGCGVNAPVCNLKLMKTEGHSVTKKRIDKMTYLRNLSLDYVKKHYADYEYLIVWDLDLVGSVYFDGIQNSFGFFEQHPDVNVVCANGIYRYAGFLSTYYDTFAHLDIGDNFDINNKLKHDIIKGLTVMGSLGGALRKVRACFSGFSIYRLGPIVRGNLSYIETPEDSLLCEHATLCDQIGSGIFMNPSMIYLVIKNE